MKFRKILCYLLILSVACALSACGPSLSACGPSLLKLSDGYDATFVGHMVEINGEYGALTDIYQGENYLKLYDDGTGVIAFSGFEEPLTWTENNSNFSMFFQNETSAASYHDGIMVVNVEGVPVTFVAEGAQAPEIPTTEPPDYDTNPYTSYGTYHGLSISYGNEAMDMAEYYKGACSITLDPDGMGTLVLGGSAQSIAWETEGNELIIADSFGINSFGIVENGIIVLDYMESGIQLAFAKEGFEP